VEDSQSADGHRANRRSPARRGTPLANDGVIEPSRRADSTAMDRHTKGAGMADWFGRIATRVAALAGHYLAFAVACGIIVVWAVSGPLFAFSDTWQLVINTGTTIVTFVMVFLIQNTQNRDAMAVHIKLDEIIRAIAEADNAVIDAEDQSELTLAELKHRYEALHNEHQSLREQNEALQQRLGSPNAA
jgi:low affinity Fe/Cu permease